MFEELTGPILSIIGSAILGSIGIFLVIVNKTISKWFMEKIWSRLKSKQDTVKESDMEKDSKIREILIELRTLVDGDRACLFQFHNGSVFSTNNPIWKVSNTHESVRPGISSEIGKLQDIKSSSIIEFLKIFWNDVYPHGVEKISPTYCGDCANKSGDTKKVIFIDVDHLEDGYSKALLIEQGIKYVLDVPIYHDGNCIGFVAVNYCSERDIEEAKKHAPEVCRNASQISFVLLEK